MSLCEGGRPSADVPCRGGGSSASGGSALSPGVLLAVAGCAGVVGLVAAFRFPRLWLGAVLVASLAALSGGIWVLAGGIEWQWRGALSIAGELVHLRLDGVSALFLVSVAMVGGAGAAYAREYWADRAHPVSAPAGRWWWAALLLSMGLLLVCSNGLHFLIAWEAFALCGYFLITLDRQKREVRAAGWLYLAASHAGTLALFAFFSLLAARTGNWDLGPVRDQAGLAPLFWLALMGFGVKAGLFPLHIWLPSAHANAPSHVSAILSGVAIKMGIYGIVRFSGWLPFSASAGWAVAVLGVASAVLGVAFALGQHDIKRLLAYHSVENIGIILMGLGLALVGRASGRLDLMVLGVAGALLHTVNHGLFKALLFLGAGSVISSSGTRELDRMGGLAKRMPVTMVTFLIGAAAISGLPPLNGFVSEFLIYLGMLRGGSSTSGNAALLVILGVPTLALVGALAVACFTKVVGVVFLGEPRNQRTCEARECPPSMWWPMVGLALSCVVIGLGPRWLTGPLHRACLDFGMSHDELGQVGLRALVPFEVLATVNGLLIVGIALGLGLLRWLVPHGRRKFGPTWDCGFAAVTPRMQYTASSFAEMLVRFFASVLRPRCHNPDLSPVFPGATRFSTHVPEVVLDLVVLPVVRRVTQARSWFLWLQTGSIQLYVLFVLAALVVMLAIWR